MRETRIDINDQTDEELDLARRQAQLVFRLNHTMPMTDEYDGLLREIFPNLPSDSQVHAPLTVVRPQNVTIGHNVVIMNGCLMMAAGGITIEDDVMIAANAQLISNNHDLQKRSVITCKPVKICRNAWIGAGATILPGVIVGENAVVGAASVVTADVPPDVIVAGNPARFIRAVAKL